MGVPGIPPYEVFATDTTLLCFDGRVLEVFGFNDTHRYHVRQEPRLEFDSGRRPRMSIVTGRDYRHTFSYDPHRLDGLRALADLLARSRPEPPSL
ncbi:hypothetical protein [Streptomyces hainanensis]|uniref:Uncharacterized protein n=1 Tax=Streptomyces hainanensis TaxID=402648 RepID=A0A4R4TML8_9ACTN|nr:hypothetical protein [Streptomyces hainanensis]TDC79090.1 hypothetical protein E1283_03565 [Streptomyces hainanensis]